MTGDPRDATLRAAGSRLAGETDAVIREALDCRLGVWALESLRGRLTTLRTAGGFETFYLDGQPFLKLHPLVVTTTHGQGAYLVTVTRKIERL